MNKKDKCSKKGSEKEVFEPRTFVEKYRKTKDIHSKVKMLSKLNEVDKKAVKKLLTKEEIAEYKKYTSALIEKRYDCIRRNKECLDMLTAKKPNIAKIKEKYINEDMSIPVYTIKAIINAYNGIPFSTNDYKYSKNAEKYYQICSNYWDIIYNRWDTDTGLLSKEDIIERNYDEYHKNANKVKTIIKTLEKGSFTRRKEIPSKKKEDNIDRANIEIYTRGIVDCSNELRQGYSVSIMTYKGRERIVASKDTNTTVNKMILKSIIESVKSLKRPCNINLYIHTDIGVGTEKDSYKSVNSDLVRELRTLIKKNKHTLKVNISKERQKELGKILRDVKKEKLN